MGSRVLQSLKHSFDDMMSTARRNYLSRVEGKSGDKAVEAVLERFRDEEPREEFFEFFRELSTIYEILSPDAFLRPYLDDFRRLGDMYRVLKENYEPGVRLERELLRKTGELVREHTQAGKVRESLEIYEIDGDTLEKIEQSQAGDTVKVFNLLRSLHKAAHESGAENPVLIDIGQRAQLIAELYKSRQRTTQQALEELKELVKEGQAAKEEIGRSPVKGEVFMIYWQFRNAGLDDAEEKANRMHDVIREYPHWRTSAGHERQFKKELDGLLLKSGKQVTEAKDLVDRIVNSMAEAEA